METKMIAIELTLFRDMWNAIPEEVREYCYSVNAYPPEFIRNPGFSMQIYNGITVLTSSGETVGYLYPSDDFVNPKIPSNWKWKGNPEFKGGK